MNLLLNILRQFLPHGALLLAALWGVHLLDRLSAEQLTVVRWLPPLCFAAAVALALRFGRGRTFFSLLNLMLGWFALAFYRPASPDFTAAILYAGVCLLLPLNLVVTAYLRERGPVFSWHNSRYLVLFAQIVALVIVAEARIVPAATLLTFSPAGNLAAFTPIPQPALLVLVLGLFLAYGRLHAEPGIQRAASLATLLAVAGVLHAGATPEAVIAGFSAAALIQALALAQESWNLAYIDTLTELPGRRALEEAMAKLGNEFSIAMVDVDHFKKFNDNYGHHVGDEVLRMVAFQLREVDGGGKAFRYGGEEFCLVFDGKRAKEVEPHLEELRARIAEARFELRQRGRRREDSGGRRRLPRGGTISITVSIGLAQTTSRQKRPHAVVGNADKALYRAKKQGRNRVCR